MSELVEDLIGDRILMAPGRAARPYDFRADPEQRQANCPFCPGREAQTPPEVFAVRPGGEPDGEGWRLRVTPNLYPAVSQGGAVAGIHEVVIETPRHDGRLADLTTEELALVLDAWRNRFLEARKDSRQQYGLVFKNQGPNAGASLEHPHSQFIALPFVPDRIAAEVKQFGSGRYLERVNADLNHLDRLIVTSRRLAALSPSGSRFAYQLWLLPREPSARFEESDDGVIEEIAELLNRLLLAQDRMLDRPDYHLLIYTAPFGEDSYWWRVELFPRLNRVAGFEWATGVFLNQVEPQRATKAWRAALHG